MRWPTSPRRTSPRQAGDLQGRCGSSGTGRCRWTPRPRDARWAPAAAGRAGVRRSATAAGAARPRPRGLLAAALPALYLVFAVLDDARGSLDAVLTGRTVGLITRSSASRRRHSGGDRHRRPARWLTVRSDLPGRRIWARCDAALVIPSYIGAYLSSRRSARAGRSPACSASSGCRRSTASRRVLVLTLFTYPLF